MALSLSPNSRQWSPIDALPHFIPAFPLCPLLYLHFPPLKSLASFNHPSSSLFPSLSLSLSKYTVVDILALYNNRMAPSKKTSNGRSPLVNQQRQITAFFCKNLESSSSPSNSPSPTQNPNPKASPSPITPSPLQSKRKPVLVISPNMGSSSTEKPSSGKKLYGAEVVNRRIRVYWPLDKSWYEGFVKSFDKISGKHLVQYDDAEEEMLNLSEEKIEWIEEAAKKKLRRLRRISLVEDEEEDDLKELKDEGVDDLKELEDDSDDEDWEGKVENEILEDEDSLEDLDSEAEEENSVRKKVSSRKRKVSEGEETVPVASKKSKIGGELKNSVSKVSPSGSAEKLIEPTNGISTYCK